MDKVRSDKGAPRAKYRQKVSPEYRQLLGRASRQGVSFELTAELIDQVLEADCTYCGASATEIARVNDQRGYAIENVQPRCETCSKMKGAQSHESFMKQIRRIVNHQDSQQ